MHPQALRIEDYTYELADERIAKHPLAERDASKLLVYDNGEITDDTYRNLANHLPKDALMVFNQTKVVNARLLFRKESGSIIEVFCLAPHGRYADAHTAMMEKGQVLWECMVGGEAKWKPGMTLSIAHEHPSFALTASIEERNPAAFILKLEWTDQELTFAEVLHYTGHVPLPPYMNRNSEVEDENRYQTVFAKEEGSVAAPTAGLHFTERVMNDIRDRGVDTAFLTLHVGAGTFRPVKSERMEGHDMHAEWIEVTAGMVERLIAAKDRKIIAVGTTSTRTLESLYWIGNKIANGHRVNPRDIAVEQWEPYETDANHSTETALTALLEYMIANKMDRLITRTRILIAPGYEFRLVDGLVTNFHQPRSTLLLLVSAFIGEDWKKVYDHALNHDYRFLSYGDGSMLWR